MTFWQTFQKNLSKPLKPVVDAPGVLRIRLCVIWLPVPVAYIPAVYAKEGDRSGIGSVYVDLKRPNNIMSQEAALKLGFRQHMWGGMTGQVDSVVIDSKNARGALQVNGVWVEIWPKAQLYKFAECSGILGQDFFKHAGYSPKVDWLRRELVLTPLLKESANV